MERLGHKCESYFPYGHNCIKEYVHRPLNSSLYNLEEVEEVPLNTKYRCNICGNTMKFVVEGSTCYVEFLSGEKADYYKIVKDIQLEEEV